jgi:broad specificity phosphatase PhoE
MGNRKGLVVGQLDIPLTELGLRQAELTALHLAEVKFDVVFTSDLMRAVNTAQAIMKYQECPLIVEKSLREINGGVFHGVSLSTLRQWSIQQEDVFTAIRPQGESLQMVSNRVIRAFHNICDRYPDSTVAIVAHQLVIRFIVQHVTGLNPRDTAPPIQNCSVTVIKTNADEMNAVTIGNTDHLKFI